MAAMPTASRAQAAAVAREQRAEQQLFDATLDASVEFAPTGPPNRSTSRRVDAGVRRAPIAVGPGRPAIVVPAVPMEGGLPGGMSEFPIQLNKVQAPPLREQTLARDRLLDWLAAKIHDRAVLVIAEAGYGKTTLLADFSRRTRLRSLWYRLDRGDRDWVGFIAHLAAAVRVHVPDFGPATAALLRETATTAPSLDVVLDTFVRELGELPPDATVLILDDFHLVDDNADIRHITRELLSRAPERLTFVFASRRVPPVPLARLRALGEIAELATDDLRFDEAETERLFRETYDMPLERGLITELSKRTEGWAASLQLVRAALHDRDAVQARAFIGSLSGAEGHLYDYLAEEVIGDLPPALQDFLMRTSILETIDLELAAVAANVSPEDARESINGAEALGLLSRRSRQRRHQVRAHPLVRQFLRERLRRLLTATEIAALHLSVAESARATDWRVAAFHFAAAGQSAEARQVVAASLDEILATGAYASAQTLVGSLEGGSVGPAGLVLASRMAFLGADPERSLALAERALSADPSSRAAAITVMSARSFAGDVPGAVAASSRLETLGDDVYAAAARAMRLVLETSVSRPLHEALDALDQVQLGLDANQPHFRGISEQLRAPLLLQAGDFAKALAAAERAIDDLESASAGIELTSARLVRAAALAALGRLQEAREYGVVIEREAQRGQRFEVAMELAATENELGDEARAGRLLESVAAEISPSTENGVQATLVSAELALRRNDALEASRRLAQIVPQTLRSAVAFEARRLRCAAELHRLKGDVVAAKALASQARDLARGQGAHVVESAATLLLACLGEESDVREAVRDRAQSKFASMSRAAEALIPRLVDLDPEGLGAVAREVRVWADRWRPSLRRYIDAEEHLAGRLAAGSLLAEVGASEDLSRLKAVDHAAKGRGAGLARTLARRIADRSLVADLGRVRIVVGGRIVEGAQVRRKVLALLCYLLSREGYSSTRDEVLDNLWPELDPPSAINSLNQTVYFLRRVFEPGFREDESPGYVHQDGETIWLDSELIDSTSRRCRELIQLASHDPEGSACLRLVETYAGKFALDFAYEEWADSYRESIHASYLRVVEQTVREQTNKGKFTLAIEIAERAALVEPDSEEIQAGLVRLYRLAGAYAAAAEHYGRYAATLSGLGVEAPPFDAVTGGPDSIGTPAY
jgi:LuxR family maltose regulon positive regulatory protein